MKKVTIKRGIKYGDRFFKVVVDGEEMSLSDASRTLTGVRLEDVSGVFSPCIDSPRVRFWHENHNKVFQWDPVDFTTAPDYVLIDHLKMRIDQVRYWAKHLDREETIRFTTKGDMNKMEVEIIRGVNCGDPFFFVAVDGKEKYYPYIASRKITGTTCEDHSGIFSSCVGGEPVRFWYGEQETEFKWKPIDLAHAPTQELIDVFQARACQVRAWVESIDREETIVFEV